MPGTGRCYHLRLVPGPDGRTLYLTDVTEKRQREEERRAAERAAAERAARIAELTAALAKATTSRDVVDAVARRVLPPFGAAGLIVQAIEGDRLHNVGAVGYPDDFLDRDRRPRPRGPTTPSGTRSLTEHPLFLSSAEEYAARYPTLADLPGRRRQAGLGVPAADRVRAHLRRLRRSPSTGRAASPTRNAPCSPRSAPWSHRPWNGPGSTTPSTPGPANSSAACSPSDLPDLPACTAAARYLPAGQGMDVGGDWYDVIPLSGGQVALVVGDVMGHGLPEAATMGRLRTAVHTLADLELPPDEIMSHLNDIVGGTGRGLVRHLPVRALRLHHPDLLHRPRRAPAAGRGPPRRHRVLPGPGRRPAARCGRAAVRDGRAGRCPRAACSCCTPTASSSRRQREIDEGMADLARLLRTAHEAGTDADLERLCDTLTAGLLPAEQQSAPTTRPSSSPASTP